LTQKKTFLAVYQFLYKNDSGLNFGVMFFKTTGRIFLGANLIHPVILNPIRCRRTDTSNNEGVAAVRGRRSWN